MSAVEEFFAGRGDEQIEQVASGAECDDEDRDNPEYSQKNAFSEVFEVIPKRHSPYRLFDSARNLAG